jgi:signal transduction histidine kinase
MTESARGPDARSHDTSAEPAAPAALHELYELQRLLATATAHAAGLHGASADEHAYLRPLTSALRDARRLAADLLADRHAEILERANVDVGPFVESLQARLSQIAGLAVAVAVRRPPAPLFVVAHPRELERVLLPLVQNAAEAIEDAGDVVIEVAALHVVDRDRARPGTVVAPHVRITVADTGSGIDAQTLPSMFDPYVSTKPERRGLGLAGVASIVRALGGWLLVESRLGAGTRMHVCLPAVEGTVSG